MLKRITLVVTLMIAACSVMPVAADGSPVFVTDDLAKVTIHNPATDIVAKENRRFNVTGEDHALITKSTSTYADGWEGFGKETNSATAVSQGNINLPYEVGWRSS
ncbi:MAG: hypothetical protein ACRBBW_13110 [Cellvibrionaceae bacterium]